MSAELHSDRGRLLSRRDMLRLSALTMAGAVAAACAPAAAPATSGEGGEAAPSQEKVSIVATTSMPINTWDNALERATEQLPNIDLKVTATPVPNWSAYSDSIVTQIAGGEQLDVIMIAIEGLRLLTNKNILVPLIRSLRPTPASAASFLMDDACILREMLQVDGKQDGVPVLLEQHDPLLQHGHL